MATFFMIIKIIVLLLAILIGMLLLCCSLALMVPVRYLAHVEREEEWRGVVRLSWLLRILTFTLEYKDKDLDIKFRLLGIRLFKKKNKEPGVKEKDTWDEEEAFARKEDSSYDKEVTVQPVEDNPKTGKMSRQTNDSKMEEEGNQAKEDIVINRENEKKPSKEKNKWKRFWASLRNRCKEFLTSWKEIKGRMIGIRNFFTNRGNQAGLKTIKREIVRFLKHAKPKTFQAKIRIGLGDPCNTGLALGALSLLYAYLGSGFHVEPDFENKVFQGTLYTKGRIRFLVILTIGIRLYRDDEVRGIVREIRKKLA